MKEIVYAQTRSGQFEPVMSRAEKKKAEKARQNRRDTILGATIIGVGFLVWASGLVIAAMV